MHPLTILANGLYGEELPKQNAPLRLVVPWNTVSNRSNRSCADHPDRHAAANNVEHAATRGIRLFRQCEPPRWTIRAGARPANGASARGFCRARGPSVQRLRRACCQPLFRARPGTGLLMQRLSALSRRLPEPAGAMPGVHSSGPSGLCACHRRFGPRPGEGH